MDTQNNVLSEIGLALAMAFFALMVLGLLSVGYTAPQQKTPDTITVTKSEANKIKVKDNRSINWRIYYKNNWFDTQLNSKTLTEVKQLFLQKKRVVIAIAPSMTAKEQLLLQQDLGQKIAPVVLSKEWVLAIKQKESI